MGVKDIISLVIQILSFLGVGTAVSYFWQDCRQRKIEKSETYKLAKREETQQLMREVITEENKEIKENVAEIKNDVKELQKNDELQKRGIQAVLRDRLYSLYRIGYERGYTTPGERENFQNLWEKYHNLGCNGVMDQAKEDYFKLPIQNK